MEVLETSNEKDFKRLLSPCKIDGEKASHYAVEDLKFALQQEEARNIAVTGHYGSGKSSVVNTSFAELGIDKKVLRISLSTFSIRNDKNDIEYKIVQHLIYKCDKKRIPFSRFHLIPHIEPVRLARYVIFSLIALLCYIIAFEPKLFRIDSFYDTYYCFFNRFGENVGQQVNAIADFLSVLYLFIYLYFAGVLVFKKANRIKSIKVETKGISFDYSGDISVFNRYLDEIIYMIQANSYKYILFEDLDRLNNSQELFLKLRELNMLINESEYFRKKRKTIKFVYAIKDDVFSRDLRTKCFDYIVAIVPVVDHYNVTDYFINEYRKAGLFKHADDATLQQLTSEIDGLRELKNIINEYTLFEKSLRMHLTEDNEEYEQKLLAIVVYKNLFPQDFSKAYQKKGLLYAVFKNKSLFYEDLTKDLKGKSAIAQEKIKDARAKIVEIRGRYLDQLNGSREVIHLIKNGYEYSLDEVAERDNLFELFINNEYDRYTYFDPENNINGEAVYSFSFKEIQDIISEDLSYFELVHDAKENYKLGNQEKKKIEKEINSIENTTLSEVILQIGAKKAEEVIKSIFQEEYSPYMEDTSTTPITPTDQAEMIETLQRFLTSGFISDDYYRYISLFYEGSMPEADYRFTNDVLLGKERPYDRRLINVKGVVDSLRTDNFRTKGILNFDILNYLIENKLESYLSCFVETARKTPEFIVDYYELPDSANKDFFSRVFDGWDSCIEIIYNQADSEKRDVLLKLFFIEAPTNIHVTDEEKKYLERQYEFICNNISFFNVSKLRLFINKYTIKFETLIRPNDSTASFYGFCVSNNSFSINNDNLVVVLGNAFSVKPISLIFKCVNARLKRYLLNNLDQIIKLLNGPCDEEERDALVNLINRKIASDDWIIEYLKKQKLIFEDTHSLDAHSMSLILQADKLQVSWASILAAFRVFEELNNPLIAFIVRHIHDLSKEMCTGEKDEVHSLCRQLLLNNGIPKELFKELLHSFDISFTLEDIEGLDDDQISEAIEQKKIASDAKIFVWLCKNSLPTIADRYLIIHFDTLVDEVIDWESIMRNSLGIHILNSPLSLSQKRFFLNDLLTINPDENDAEELAKLVCEYYNRCGVEGANQDLIIDALSKYQQEGSWETKITLINRCNASWEYDPETENALLNCLGGGYVRLTYPRGWAEFDINEHNNELLQYLKRVGHYINNIEEKKGLYYVTFKHK